MVKFLYVPILFYYLFVFTSLVHSQTDWEYVGVFKDKEVYYLKSSVLKGNITYVIAVLKPKTVSLDDEGKEYEYVTLKCLFRKNNRNEVKCIISNRIYYYNDKSHRKSDMQNIELDMNYDRIISDLYNKIK